MFLKKCVFFLERIVPLNITTHLTMLDFVNWVSEKKSSIDDFEEDCCQGFVHMFFAETLGVLRELT